MLSCATCRFSQNLLSVSRNLFGPPTRKSIGAVFRNVLVHGCLGINVTRVWEIIERDLPIIERFVAAIQKEQGLTDEGNHG